MCLTQPNKTYIDTEHINLQLKKGGRGGVFFEIVASDFSIRFLPINRCLTLNVMKDDFRPKSHGHVMLKAAIKRAENGHTNILNAHIT
jgi:hypothetical protein